MAFGELLHVTVPQKFSLSALMLLQQGRTGQHGSSRTAPPLAGHVGIAALFLHYSLRHIFNLQDLDIWAFFFSLPPTEG